MSEQGLVKYDFGKKCVCVGRVSTAVQSQTAQIRDLEEFAKNLGYEDVQMFFTTESGFLEYDDKQGWNLVSDYFDNHPDYKVLICPEISRLSRREHILHKIKDYLIDKKIQLIIKDIKFTLFDEWGEIPKGNDLIFALYASLADSEMRQKKERVARVLRDYKQSGYSIGGKVLFGYDRIKVRKNGKDRSKYVINEEQAEEIRTIYRWYAFGIDGDVKRATVLSITKECIERGFSKYLHSKRNVNKCLKEQAYCGQKETHNRIKNPDYWNYNKKDAPKYLPAQSYICTYPAIFIGDDAALFNLVQQRMKENNTRYSKSGDNLTDKSHKHTNILAKLLVCPECGTYLNAEYRMSTHSQRPHLGKQASFTYRCNYSRSVVHVCSFRRSLSMPMLDSVVWAYCQRAIMATIRSESDKDINARIAEIDEKIANITVKIQEFDIKALIKSEDAILRTKLKITKDASAIDEAIQEYEERVNKIEQELNDYKARKLELEEEKKAIKLSKSVWGSINKDEIKSNKKLLYKHIHNIVDYIEFIGWDSYHTVLKIHFKHSFTFYKENEYICIYSKTTKNITALTVHSYNERLQEITRKILSEVELNFDNVTNDAIKRDFIDKLPSSDDLYWDSVENKFKVQGFSFTLDEMKDFYEYPSIRINPLNPRLGATVAGAPVHIKKLDVERLTCYEEDIRE